MQPCISRTLPCRYCTARVTVLEVAPPRSRQLGLSTAAAEKALPVVVALSLLRLLPLSFPAVISMLF